MFLNMSYTKDGIPIPDNHQTETTVVDKNEKNLCLLSKQILEVHPIVPVPRSYLHHPF